MTQPFQGWLRSPCPQDQAQCPLRRAVDFDDAKLKTIGWGGRKEPTPLAAPGRARDSMSGEQGEGTIQLSWKKPTDGGKVAAYEIRCRERTGHMGWKTVGTAMDTKVTLTGQERNKELEYVVVAMNKAGGGPVSNVVMAVL